MPDSEDDVGDAGDDDDVDDDADEYAAGTKAATDSCDNQGEDDAEAVNGRLAAATPWLAVNNG
jgi:hypothetical protein